MKCYISTCTETATFGFVGRQKTKCTIHKDDGMNDYNLRECAWDGCTTVKPQWYRFGEETMRKYCSKCRMNDHTIIHNPKITICNVDGCVERGTTIDKKDETKKYCSAHKRLANNQKCAFEGDCSAKTPIYGYWGNTRHKWCAKHKTKDMFNIVSKRCQHKDETGEFDCNSINPSFGYWPEEGESKKPTVCFAHSVLGMVNLNLERCNYIDDDNERCMTTGSVRDPDDPEKKKYCKAHKSSTMRNMNTAAVCIEDGCGAQKSFGVIVDGKKIITHCGSHANLSFMTNLRKRTCKYEPEKGEEVCDTPMAVAIAK